jgi:hypothetical protein
MEKTIFLMPIFIKKQSNQAKAQAYPDRILARYG